MCWCLADLLHLLELATNHLEDGDRGVLHVAFSVEGNGPQQSVEVLDLGDLGVYVGGAKLEAALGLGRAVHRLQDDPRRVVGVPAERAGLGAELGPEVLGPGLTLGRGVVAGARIRYEHALGGALRGGDESLLVMTAVTR